MAEGGLTLARFQPLIGSHFTLQTDGSAPATARLVEARASGRAPPQGQPPFSLLFEAATEPALPQRIYRLTHEQLGALDLFLVPVARTATGLHYEAVFG